MTFQNLQTWLSIICYLHMHNLYSVCLGTLQSPKYTLTLQGFFIQSQRCDMSTSEGLTVTSPFMHGVFPRNNVGNKISKCEGGGGN